jgi:hypothetical protein
MMLAFLIDQIQQHGCRLFQAALPAAQGKTRLWRKLRSRFDLCLIPDWETLYRSIIQPPLLPLPHVDERDIPHVRRDGALLCAEIRCSNATLT